MPWRSAPHELLYCLGVATVACAGGAYAYVLAHVTRGLARGDARFEPSTPNRPALCKLPLYDDYATGVWTPDSAFVASHGPAFEDFTKEAAVTGDADVIVPLAVAAMALGIANGSPRAELRAFLAVVAFAVCFRVARHRPFANDATNTVESLAAGLDAVALALLAAAASDSRDSGLFVDTAAVIYLVMLVVLVLIPAVAAVLTLFTATKVSVDVPASDRQKRWQGSCLRRAFAEVAHLLVWFAYGPTATQQDTGDRGEDEGLGTAEAGCSSRQTLPCIGDPSPRTSSSQQQEPSPRRPLCSAGATTRAPQPSRAWQQALSGNNALVEAATIIRPEELLVDLAPAVNVEEVATTICRD